MDRKMAGVALRDKRMSLGFSLDQVSRATMLRNSVLESLESGGPAHVNGFTRSYARRYAEFLGLDGNEIVAPFREVTSEKEPAQDRDTSSRSTRGRMSARTFARKRSVIPGVMFGIVLLVGTVLLLSRPWAQQPTTPSNDVTTPSSPIGEQPGTLTEQPSDDVPSGKPAITGSVSLEFAATTRRAWLEIVSDGQIVFSGTLRPGDTALVSGKYVIVNFGNAMYTNVRVNGEDRGLVSNDQTVLSAEYGTRPGTP